MRKIIYYVASSIDGFISGPNNNVDSFIAKGNGVERYLNDLKSFDTVIMGKNTYEFGYKYGMKSGQAVPLYSHMQHYIFSNSLKLESRDDNVKVEKINLEAIRRIRDTAGTDIYLCGGGQFAGWLLDNGQIDVLKIKLNPLVLGEGTPLFGSAKRKVRLDMLDSQFFEEGLQTITYQVKY